MVYTLIGNLHFLTNQGPEKSAQDMQLEDLGFVPHDPKNDPYNTGHFFPTDSLQRPIRYMARRFLRYHDQILFTHYSLMRRAWEYLIILLAMFVPMEVLFIVLACPNISISVFWVTFLADACFALDHFLIRRTTFLSDIEVVTRPKEIARAYGKCALIIHLISIFPLSWIGIILHNRWIYFALSLNRALRLHRGYRALRNVTTMLPYAGGALSILPYFYFLILAIHVFSCIFLGVAMSQGYEHSFLAPFHARNFTLTQMYFVTVYFVMTTILTIGFGDIAATTTIETVITIFAQLTGVAVHSILTSYLVAILIDPVQTDYVHHYKVMQEYLRQKKVPRSHRKAVREYCQYQWETTRGTGNVKRILQSLPSVIRNTITLEMTRTFFQLTDTFTALTQGQLVRVTQQMSFKTYSPGDTICEQGAKADRMYFFRSGILSFIVDGHSALSQNCGQGIVHGEYEMLIGESISSTVKALTYVECWIYRLEDLIELLEKNTLIRIPILDRLQLNNTAVFPQILQRLVPNETIRNRYIEMCEHRKRVEEGHATPEEEDGE